MVAAAQKLNEELQAAEKKAQELQTAGLEQVSTLLLRTIARFCVTICILDDLFYTRPYTQLSLTHTLAHTLLAPCYHC
jgi:hypothetical protein